MRISRRWWLLAAFFLFSLLALLPLRLAIDFWDFGRMGLSARAATGSLWFGVLQEARLGPAALGDVGARLNLLPLLVGRARLSLFGAEESGGFRGAVTLSRHAVAFDDVRGRINTASSALPLPIAAIEFDDVSVAFSDGRCTRAEGRVQAQGGGAMAGIGVASRMNGVARCAGGWLLLPLVGETGAERLNLRFDAGGRWRADFAVRAGDAATDAQLAAAGFRRAGSSFVRRFDGAF
ncbi:MAG: type II secretion system protein N [Sphingosinicella sp.]